MNPAQFLETVTLKNGLLATIRAIRPSDKAALVEAYDRFDPESFYTRFFRTKGELTERQLKTATEVDFEKVVALVVMIERGGREVLAGGGRYMTFERAGQRHAEVAFLVEQGYQGLGIAGRVLDCLIRIARERGIHQFEAEVLPQNRAMLSVFERSGLPMTQTAAEGTIHATRSLADRPPAGGRAL